MEELADLHRRGNTIIMVTHNPDLTSYSSRIITMLDGRIDSDKELAKKAIFSKKLEIKDESSHLATKIKVSKTPDKKTSKKKRGFRKSSKR